MRYAHRRSSERHCEPVGRTLLFPCPQRFRPQHFPFPVTKPAAFLMDSLNQMVYRFDVHKRSRLCRP
jgi:hypothetical protein